MVYVIDIPHAFMYNQITLSFKCFLKYYYSLWLVTPLFYVSDVLRASVYCHNI